MQPVGQNQYDFAHEFNIYWPYGFNMRILVWKTQICPYPFKNICRRVEPLNGSLCLEFSQHLDNRLPKPSIHPSENLDLDTGESQLVAHGGVGCKFSSKT